jgi:hypothetical protein
VTKKEYSEKVTKAAEQMREIFPEADMNGLLEFISQNPNIPFEELVESYLMK